MITLKVLDTLFEYDGPQIVECIDKGKCSFIGISLTDKSATKFLFVRIKEHQLVSFKKGVMDLRELIDSREDIYWYTSSLYDVPSDIDLIEHSDEIPEEYLPDEGFYLDPNFSVEEILSEVKERDIFLIKLSLELEKTKKSRSSISAYLLGDILKGLQTLVYAMARYIYHENSNALPQRIRALSELDVIVPASPGSFEVTLGPRFVNESRRYRSSESLMTIMTHIDEIIKSSSEINLLANQNLPFDIKVLNSYKGLLKTIRKGDTSVHYSFADPRSDICVNHLIRRKEILNTIKTLDNVGNEVSEKIIYRGELIQCDVNKKTWTLCTDDRIVQGKDTGVSTKLRGLTIGGHYIFSCLEIKKYTVAKQVKNVETILVRTRKYTPRL